MRLKILFCGTGTCSTNVGAVRFAVLFAQNAPEMVTDKVDTNNLWEPERLISIFRVCTSGSVLIAEVSIYVFLAISRNHVSMPWVRSEEILSGLRKLQGLCGSCHAPGSFWQRKRIDIL